MIKTAVCDDKIPMQKDLQRRTRQQETECEITCFSSGRELSSNRKKILILILPFVMVCVLIAQTRVSIYDREFAACDMEAFILIFYFDII